jgi:hypothetical protein
MNSDTADTATKAFLKELRERLERAVSIAKAAETCAEAGDPGKGVEIMLDVEPLVFEANALLNAASLMRRFGET